MLPLIWGQDIRGVVVMLETRLLEMGLNARRSIQPGVFARHRLEKVWGGRQACLGLDEVAIDGGGMDAASGFAQQLARVLLTFFLGGGIVCVWEEWGRYVSFYRGMLILQRLLRMKTCNGTLFIGRVSQIGRHWPAVAANLREFPLLYF